MSNETLNEEPKATVVAAEVKAVVEALIFASPDPMTPKMLFKLLAEEPKEATRKHAQAASKLA